MQTVLDSIADRNLRTFALWCPGGAIDLNVYFIDVYGQPTSPVVLSLTTTPSSLLTLYRNATSSPTAELPGQAAVIHPTTTISCNFTVNSSLVVGHSVSSINLPSGVWRVGGASRLEDKAFKQIEGIFDLEYPLTLVPSLRNWCLSGKGGTATLIAEVYNFKGAVVDRITLSVPSSGAYSVERLYQYAGETLDPNAVGMVIYSTSNGVYYNSAGNGNPSVNEGVKSGLAPASGSRFIDVNQFAVLGRPMSTGVSSVSTVESPTEFSLGNFVADQSRVVTAHGYTSDGLAGIQTWTVTATAQNLASLSGFSDLDAQCWYVSNISGGKVMWLPCALATQTVDVSGSPGYRLRVGDIIGTPVTNGRELESLFLVFTGTSLIKQSSSTTLNTGTGNRLSTAGGTPSNTPAIVDSLNYKLREIQLVVNATVADVALTGSAVLEVYQALDEAGTLFETTPFYSEELPVVRNQAMRHVLPMVPGVYKIDILNECGANLTAISFSTKAITR